MELLTVHLMLVAIGHLLVLRTKLIHHLWPLRIRRHVTLWTLIEVVLAILAQKQARNLWFFRGQRLASWTLQIGLVNGTVATIDGLVVYVVR